MRWGLAILYKHFGWLIAGIEIGGHLETVGAGVVKDKIITFTNFVDGAGPGEGIGLADIADDGILFWRAAGVADIFDAMIGVVEHGADQVVETAVDAYEGGGIGSLLSTFTFVIK